MSDLNNIDLNNLNVDNLDPNSINIKYPDEFNQTMNLYQQTKGLMCNEECRKNKKVLDLYHKYERAKHTEDTSKEELKKARRDYIVASKGQDAYNSIIEQEETEKAKRVVEKLKNRFNQQTNELETYIEQLNTQEQSVPQLKFVDTVYSQQTDNLKNVMNTIDNNQNIQFRKAQYAEKDIEWSKQLISLIQWWYWFVLVIYVIVIVLIGQGFRYKKIWITLGVLILYPYAVSYGIQWIPMDWWISVSFKDTN